MQKINKHKEGIEILQNHVLKIIDNMKGEDIITLNISKLTQLADYMIIASARSTRQLKAVADEIVEKSKMHGASYVLQEGEPETGWVIVDLGDIIVHLMLPSIRSFYNLEELWSISLSNSTKEK